MVGEEWSEAGTREIQFVGTAEVKRELSRVSVRTARLLRAEASALLRFGATMQVLSGRIVVQAEVDLAATAWRLQVAIAELYRHPSEVVPLSGNRYLVRVIRDGEDLARKAGLIDERGIPVRGLPPMLARASRAETEALWRGVFLAAGSLKYRGRRPLLGIRCPGPETAMALGWAASRLGFETTTKEERDILSVVVSGSEGIDTLLRRTGAHTAAQHLQSQYTRAEQRMSADEILRTHGANYIRTKFAAETTAAKARKALEILGDDAPARLRHAGELRIKHRQANLTELGELSKPPISKDTIAGRLRRLVALAEQREATQNQTTTPTGNTPKSSPEAIRSPRLPGSQRI